MTQTLEPGAHETYHLPGDVVLIHTSDIHIGMAPTPLRPEAEGLSDLRTVLDASRECDADVLILAGDTFDHARVENAIVDEVGLILAEAKAEVVILPGNHDCLTPTSPLAQGSIADIDGVHVIGITSPDCIVLPSIGLEIWGRPHRDYAYMRPMVGPLPERIMPWRVVVAHGHWNNTMGSRSYGWQIEPGDLANLDADYVALGHWDNPYAVVGAPVPCYYSGAPGWAGTVNVVTLSHDQQHSVIRHRIATPLP